MQHPRPRLTPYSRLVLVQLVRERGYSAAQTAELLRISRATTYKWLRRYQEEGMAGLEDRSCRAHRLPHRVSDELEERVVQARRELRCGPHRLAVELGLPRSTVYRVLQRHGLSRLATFDRTHTIPVRYVRELPGELLHIDVKKLGRIPEGGGWRLLGQTSMQTYKHQQPPRGRDCVHVAIDDATRLAFVQVFADERAQTAVTFLKAAVDYFADLGVPIQRVLTDRAYSFTQKQFTSALAELGIRHKLSRPYRPQTNGKAERFIRTMLHEWAFARLYENNQARLAALPLWLDFYNRRRPHTALRGLTPAAVLVNKGPGNNT